MTQEEAIQLIQKGVRASARQWVDLGAGSGVFTKALASIIGPEGHIIAVDQNAIVKEITSPLGAAQIEPVQADFSSSLELPPLDGILMANSLHYIEDQYFFYNSY